MFPSPKSLTDLPAKERQEREALIKEAYTWLRTPYIHATDIKGVGCDCAMLLVRCTVDTGLLAPFDPRPYPQFWHLRQNEERYKAWMAQFGEEVDEPTIGDIIILKYGRVFSHGGIIVNATQMIHAYARDQMVVLGDLFNNHELMDDEISSPDQYNTPGKPRPARQARFYTLWPKDPAHPRALQASQEESPR